MPTIPSYWLCVRARCWTGISGRWLDMLLSGKRGRLWGTKRKARAMSNDNRGSYGRPGEPLKIEDYAPLTMDAYQEKALATKAKDMGLKLASAVDALGVSGESAEVLEVILGLILKASKLSEHVKKIAGHGHPAELALLTKELGDVLWYVAALASNFGLSLGDIARMNLEKLAKRYPGGEFDSERSRVRSQEDV